MTFVTAVYRGLGSATMAKQCNRCKGHKQMCISISQDSEVSSRGFGCVALPGASLPDIRPENAAESRRPLPPASDGRRATAHTAGTAQSTSRFHKALQRAVNTLAHSYNCARYWRRAQSRAPTVIQVQATADAGDAPCLEPLRTTSPFLFFLPPRHFCHWSFSSFVRAARMYLQSPDS